MGLAGSFTLFFSVISIFFLLLHKVVGYSVLKPNNHVM